MSCSRSRIDRLRAAYGAAGARAMLVRGTTNIQWLTAFDGVFDEEQAHALYIDAERAVLHTDSRYATACRREATAGGDVVAVDDARESHAAFAARMAADAVAASEIAIEDGITLAEYRALQRAFSVPAAPSAQAAAAGTPAAQPQAADAPVRFCETSGVVFGLRAVKDADEVRRMRAAQAITDAAFSHIIVFMRPGMTEREVQIELEDYMLRHGASALAFPSIVATGANGASPHAIPGETRLEAGQCVVMDFGAKAQGYCSDMTRTVFLGAPSDTMRAAWDTLRRANEEVEALLRPGVAGCEAHELAERVLAEGGFEGRMGHGLGHGVGIDIHEEPVLSPRNKEPLVAGNVVTVEPGIYLPGEFGMRLEDFGIVTDDGFEVFTRSTHEPVIL